MAHSNDFPDGPAKRRALSRLVKELFRPSQKRDPADWAADNRVYPETAGIPGPRKSAHIENARTIQAARCRPAACCHDAYWKASMAAGMSIRSPAHLLTVMAVRSAVKTPSSDARPMCCIALPFTVKS